MNKSKKRGTFLATLFLVKNRRGSHVGMILSFVIFITFIVFLYTVVRPIVSTGEDKKTTLDYINSKIMKNVSTNFTSAGLQIVSTKNPNKNCVRFTILLAYLGIYPITGGYDVIVKNETGSIQPAYIIDPTSADLEINRNVASNLFFKIYSSSEFPALSVTTINSGQCPTVIDYNISSVNIGSYVFENNMYELIATYRNNYDQLKTNLKVPPANEFGFDFTQANKTKISLGNVTTSTSIYAEEIPIQYIDKNANILSGFINIKVW